MENTKEEDKENKIKAAVRIIRLDNGQDIIAECAEDELGFLTLYHPFRLFYAMRGDEDVGIFLSPWFNEAVVNDEQEFEIDGTKVLTYGYPNDKLLEHYYTGVLEIEKEKKKNHKRPRRSRKVVDELKKLDSFEENLGTVTDFVQQALSNLSKKRKRSKR